MRMSPPTPGGDLVILLGTDSTVGRALSRHRTDAALMELRWWQEAVGTDGVRVEVASHRSRAEAARRPISVRRVCGECPGRVRRRRNCSVSPDSSGSARC